VQNNPVNFVDPLGLKGGVLIPLRNWFQRTVKWWDITLDPVIDALGISTNPYLLFASFYIFPKEANVPNEEALMRSYLEKTAYKYDLKTLLENPYMWRINSLGPEKEFADPCLRQQ
jgi:hypothetical protein